MSLSTEKARWLTALIAVAVLITATFIFSDVVFQTNDDNSIVSAASGGITGAPFAGNGYTSYIYGALLSRLYGAAPAVPWHALIMTAAQIVALIALLRSILFITDARGISPVWGILAFAALYIGIGLKFITHLQFTAAPGYCAGALAALLWTLPKGRRARIFSCIIGALLMTLAVLLRVKGGLLSLPVPLMVGAMALGKRDGSHKAVLATCSAVIILTGAILVTNDALYKASDAAWVEYESFDEASAALLDYNNNDEAYALAAEATDWSPELMACVRNWSLLFDARFNTENLVSLAEAIDGSAARPTAFDVLYKTGSILRRYSEFGINAAVFALIGVWSLVRFLRAGRWREAILLAGSALSMLAVIALFYGVLNRLPDRVAFAYAWPVYSVALLLFFDSFSATDGIRIKRISAVGTASALLTALLTVIPLWDDIMVLPSSERASRARLCGQANEYAASHAGNVYVTDVSQSFYAFSAERPPVNLIDWSSALIRSPLYAEKLRVLGYADGFDCSRLTDANVRVLFSSQSSLNAMMSCLNADYGAHAAAVEESVGGLTAYRLTLD